MVLGFWFVLGEVVEVGDVLGEGGAEALGDCGDGVEVEC